MEKQNTQKQSPECQHRWAAFKT